MELKEPTPCCKSPTLLWSREKTRYICPCGDFQATETGRRIKPPPIIRLRKKAEA